MPDEATSHVLAAASLPWAFTQAQPLGTAEFCKEAERRGIRVDETALRELWRVGALVPFVEIRTKQAYEPTILPGPEPQLASTYVPDLHQARATGRLIDPAELGYRPQLRFSPPKTKDGMPRLRWWNGLLYSRWQLIDLHDVRYLLTQGHGSIKNGRHIWRSRKLEAFFEPAEADRRRRRSTLLVALEPRYLPAIEKGWVSPIDASVEEWDSFVSTFDPQSVLDHIGATPDEVLAAADRLLRGVKDPLDGDWSELVRRAPRRRWEQLSGAALAAIDSRIAAEVLLLCYEDLAGRDQTAPLSERGDTFQTARERISYRREPLDAALSALGLSPHPGVVLVVEGETEEYFVTRVRDHIRIPKQAEVIQSVVLRGVGSDVTKLAAFASAPLIDGERAADRPHAEDWPLVKPPTRLMVVVDPDKGFDTPAAVDEQRQKIVDEIVAVVRAQGVEPERAALESLVEVRTWQESCFEFEHFTDSELAEALLAVHPCGSLSKDGLIEILGKLRAQRKDIKTLWSNWTPKVGKVELAEALWPVLREQLDAAADDHTIPVPPIADRLIDAFQSAVHRPHGHFLLKGKAIKQ